MWTASSEPTIDEPERKRDLKAEAKQTTSLNKNKGSWSQEEQSRFVKAYEKYGRNFVEISKFVGTRDRIQVKRYVYAHERKL